MKKISLFLLILLTFILGSCEESSIPVDNILDGEQIEQKLLEDYNNKSISMSTFELPTSFGDVDLYFTSSNTDVITNDGSFYATNNNVDIDLSVSYMYEGTSYTVLLEFTLVYDLSDDQIAQMILNWFRRDISSGYISSQFTYFSNIIDGADITLYTHLAPNIDSNGTITFPGPNFPAVENTFDVLVSYGSSNIHMDTLVVNVAPADQSPQEMFNTCMDNIISWDNDDLLIETGENPPAFPIQVVCDSAFRSLTYTSPSFKYIDSEGFLIDRPSYLSGSDTQTITISSTLNDVAVSYDYTFTIEESVRPKIAQIKTATLDDNDYFSTAAMLLSKDDSNQYNTYTFSQMNEILFVTDTTNEIPFIDMNEGDNYVLGGFVNSTNVGSESLYIDEVIDFWTVEEFRTNGHKEILDNYTGVLSNYGKESDGALPASERGTLFNVKELTNISLYLTVDNWIRPIYDIRYDERYDAGSTVTTGYSLAILSGNNNFDGSDPLSITGYTIEETFKADVILECDRIVVDVNNVSFISENEVNNFYYSGYGCNYVLISPENPIMEIHDFQSISDGSSTDTAGIVTELDLTNDTGVVYVDEYYFNISGDLSGLEIGKAYAFSGSKVNSGEYEVVSSEWIPLYNEVERASSMTTDYRLITNYEVTSSKETDWAGDSYTGIRTESPNTTFLRDELLSVFSFGKLGLCAGKVYDFGSYYCTSVVTINTNIYLSGGLSPDFDASTPLNTISTDGEYDILGEITAFDRTNSQITITHDGSSVVVDINLDCSTGDYCFVLTDFTVGNVYAFEVTKTGSSYKLDYIFKPHSMISAKSSTEYAVIKLDLSETHIADGKLYLVSSDKYNSSDIVSIGYLHYLEIDAADQSKFLSATEVYIIGITKFERIDDPTINDIGKVNSNTRYAIKNYTVGENINIFIK